MKRTLRHFLTVCILMAPAIVAAQDGRYSQYFNNTVYLNPANAGNGIQYIRVTGIYRTQWAGLGTPFTTQGFAVDKVVNRVGIGGVINRQGAGDAGIRTLNIVGNLSYNLPIGKSQINTLSGGLQVGIINKSFDPNKMSFDNQYDPDAGYDPNLSSGEIFTTTSVSRPDINMGFMWQRGWGRDDVKFKPFAGISFSHLNRPNETFIIDGNKAPVKKSIYLGAGIEVTDHVIITPSAMLLRQDVFKENTFGSSVSYKLDNSNAIHFGLYDRLDDAIIAYAGYQLNQVMLGMSYDASTSELSRSGKGINAFEISLAWSPLPKKKKEKPVETPEERTDEVHLPVLELNLPIGKTPEMQMAERPVTPEPQAAPEPVAVVVIPAPVVQTTTENVSPVPNVTPQQVTNDVTDIPETITPVVVPHEIVPQVKTVPQVDNRTTVTAQTRVPETLNAPAEVPLHNAQIETVPVEKAAVVVIAPSVPETLNTPVEAPVQNVQTDAVPLENVTPLAVHPEVPETIAAPADVHETLQPVTAIPGITTTTVESVKEVAPAAIAAPESIQEPIVPVEIDKIPVVTATVVVPEKVTPAVDSDNDGIPDEKDACPFIKGSRATNGCPDSDGDGVQDLVDKCPMVAGTAANGGCPDVKTPVTETQILVKKFDNVLFWPGSSELNTPDIFDIIERAIEIMFRDPSTQVVISGHTDNEGDAAVNMVLSQARADAVKQYMIKMGIDGSRIRTVAYGENMPLENNADAEGKRLNRRAEINVVKP
ncbi:MAG TPA: PorP/SprF family type IX secretion system membrane protein [Bacteroidia bacterium]|nr:PorP/SprF family type IX secretion system membrane protein [Bacteroidia bacterium]